jgi:hypothetical protein
MPSLRTHSLSTKVTREEYAQIEERAGAQILSEWVREVLLRGGRPDPVDQAVLAELVALRAILLNLHFTIANGGAMTVEQMQTLIDRADEDKWDKAQARLAAAMGRSE